MAERCTKPWPRPDGSTTGLLGCCRLAGHVGDCHGHFTGRLAGDAHTTIQRATGYPILCSEGEALDAADGA